MAGNMTLLEDTAKLEEPLARMQPDESGRARRRAAARLASWPRSGLQLLLAPAIVLAFVLAHQQPSFVHCDQQARTGGLASRGWRTEGGELPSSSSSSAKILVRAGSGAPAAPTELPASLRSGSEVPEYANIVGRARPGRVRRLAAYGGRSKTGRIMLAQRPKSTTSTSTSTTRPSSSTGAPGDEAAEESEAAESNDSGDYEEIDSARRPKTSASSSSGEAPRLEEEAEGEAEGEEEAAEEEATTTTTQRTTTAARRAGGPRKGTAARHRDAGSTSTSRPTQISRPGGRQKSKQEVEEEKKEEEAGERRKADEAAGADSTKAPISDGRHLQHRKRPLVTLPFIRPKNSSACISEAYLEFPRDLIGEKWRARGLILVHVLVVCYMFYSLALVCERYFMPSLEEFAQRLEISEDVAGATLMSAGSSAPELFTAILGVFVAKGDVGTGAIVGSAVFNILFVIGVCAFVSTTTAQLQWWPVLRDSVYYTFTVLVLILIIYDERITAFESASMIGLYGVYIFIMAHNEQLKESVTRSLLSYPLTAKLISSQSIVAADGPDDVFGSTSLSGPIGLGGGGAGSKQAAYATTIMPGKRVEEDSVYLAALLLVVRHKRLFRSSLRFQSAARYIITKRQHKAQAADEAQRRRQQEATHEEVNYFGPESEPLGGGGGGSGAQSAASRRAKIEAYAKSASMSKNKFSIVSKDDYEFWHRPPEEGENYYLWLAKIPVNYVLHYTIPDCTLYPDKYALTFVISIIWTALFSYVMVWMVTIIGYTLGVPDSVMGVTFLAAGTSVPDCYSSIHAARNGMADMAVSNSIGSNVFDILIGLAVPWFIQSAIYPGVVATINSRGVIYSVVLLFLSLIVTIYLLNRCDWSLQPRLGLALIIAYAVFIVLTCMLEFNLFGHVNPPPCPQIAGNNY